MVTKLLYNSSPNSLIAKGWGLFIELLPLTHQGKLFSSILESSI